MQDFGTALLFFAMLLAPCFVAMWAGQGSEEPPAAFAKGGVRQKG